MLQDKTVGFIGAGNMAEAMISGLLGSGLSQPEKVVCADVRADRLRDLEVRYGIRGDQDNLAVIDSADIVIYAVKPQIMNDVLKETAARLNPSKLILSIAAGIPLATLAAHSREPLRLVRAMPNICVAVKAGATAIVAGPHATAEDRTTATAIFESVGRCVVVPAEHLLDAVTGLSGSGPAYVLLILEALSDAGVKVGLGRQEALILAAQTVLGTAQMQLQTGDHPAQIKDRVTSPGGTTIAGLHALEKGGLRAILMDAVEAAANRSRQLGTTPPKGEH
ncbi:MAG: pyrroline-5-carboxylate reductase [Desulfatitalea sp.]|nr:pyrroline-5-carboxylate reductase [Desulfatitalea sp.]